MKRFFMILLCLLLVYLLLPFVSGMVGYLYPSGPKIYPRHYHLIAHRVGRAIVGKPGSKSPLEERPWFYGMKRKPLVIQYDNEVKK